MTKFRCMLLSVFASMLVLLLLSGPAQGASQAERMKAGEIAIYAPGEPPTMDPTRQADSVSGFWLSHIYEGLMNRDESGNNIPGVARSVDKSADGRAFTFHLRKDSRWHDGKPVTAADFVFAFHRLVDPKFASHYAFIATTAKIENAAAIIDGKMSPGQLGVKAIDAYTLRVTLAEPIPYFLSLMSFSAFYPVRSDLVEKFGDKFATSIESVMGNGPFKMVGWKHEAFLRVEKATTYWNAASVSLNAIEVPVFANDIGTYYNLFVTGGLDVILLDKERLVQAQKEQRPISVFSGGDSYWIEMNQRAGRLFTNQHLRQALRYGLNRNEYVNRIVGVPGTKVLFGVVPDYIPGSSSSSTFRRENKMRWKDADLKEAHAQVDTYLATTKKKTVPPFSLLVAEGVPQTHSEYLQGQLMKIFRTEVKLERVPFKTRLQRSRDGDFDVAWGNWVPDYLDASTFLEIFMSDNSNNKGYFSNKEYDDLLNKANSEMDSRKRISLLGKAEQILVEREAAVVPYYSQVKVYLLAPRLTGVARQAIGGVLDFREAHWKGKVGE